MRPELLMLSYQGKSTVRGTISREKAHQGQKRKQKDGGRRSRTPRLVKNQGKTQDLEDRIDVVDALGVVSEMMEGRTDWEQQIFNGKEDISMEELAMNLETTLNSEEHKEGEQKRKRTK